MGLWGKEFDCETISSTKETIERLKNPIESIVIKKKPSSLKVPIEEKLESIKSSVLKILGRYKEDTIVLKSRAELSNYIDESIKNGIIAIDTETNNSLDPITCKIMGLCIYTPTLRQAYVPINHVDLWSRERLSWQLTERDIYEELSRLGDTKTILHNAKFDYEVIKCTCGYKVNIYWDTLIGAKLLDENEPTGLKQLYKEKIDPTVEKYSIEHLFEGLEYAIVEPDLFALYAATDAMMTYKLYRYQQEIFHKKGNEKLLSLALEVEMPIVEVTAEMELTGVTIDREYADRLSKKYNAQVEKIFAKIREEEKKYYNQIEAWRKTKEANEKPKVVTGGKEKLGKSKSEQLETPMNLSSPTQLAIFLYDVLKIPVVNKKTPRGTGEEILKEIHLPICDLILEARGVQKLINTYIDALPKQISPKDNRLHAQYHQYGAACITRDSIVLTSSGYNYIGDIFKEEDPYGEFIEDNTVVVNRDLAQESVSHRIRYQSQDTIKLKIRGDYTIEGTYNHPIVCTQISLNDIRRNKYIKQKRRLVETQEFRTLDAIAIGDTVAIPYGYNIFPTEYQTIKVDTYKKNTNSKQVTISSLLCNEDFAEFLGMYHADGSIHESNGTFSIRINNQDPDVKNRVVELVKRLFGVDCGVYHSGITITSAHLRWLKNYLKVGARNKTVPKIIMQSPRSVICAYIRGLTLDSTLDRNRQRLSMSIFDRNTYTFVKDALLNIGIISGGSKTHSNREYDHMGNKVGSCTYYRLHIVGEMYGKFLSEIGVVQSKKSLVLPKYKKPHYLTYDNFYFGYVTDIEYGNNDVYDIHVPNTHSFIANGLINHNTGRFSSSNPNL